MMQSVCIREMKFSIAMATAAFNNKKALVTGGLCLNLRKKVMKCYSWSIDLKVAGSIPAGVSGIFHLHNPSDRRMALGLTKPLTEMSTRSIFWNKGGRCVRLTTYHHPVPLSRKLGTSTSWNPLGHRPVLGLLYLYYE